MRIRNLHLPYIMMAISFLLLSSAQLTGQTVVTYTANDSWVVPLGVTSVKIEAWGGGGGGAIGNVLSGLGNGGGGGAHATQTFSVNAGETYFITIGAGGSGNALDPLNPTNKDGKTSSFSGPFGTLTANGGAGGTAVGGGGAGGTGTYNGGKGGNSGSGYSGAGGGGAGNAGNGANGGTTVAGAGGTGNPNAAPYKGGAGGVGRNGSGVGNGGNVPGGGGAGGKGTTTETRAGGIGARGQVVITFSYDQCFDGTLTLQQNYGEIDQTVEQYYPIEDIVFGLEGNATGVNSSGFPSGVTGSLNAGVYTITGTPLESGIFDYSLITTGTPSPCKDDTLTGTITVTPEPYNPLAGRVVFNESGAWQVPEKVANITIKAWGGGGGGGAASNGAGGGGGGGAYTTTTIPVTSGEIYTINIGSGGAGGYYSLGNPGTADGQSGNPSTIWNPSSVSMLVAPGGSGGGGGLGTLSGLSIVQRNGTGGAGGTGDFSGGTGGTASNSSGSGGGGAGSGGSGGNGSTASAGTGGQGSPNIAPFIGGNGGSARSNNGQGNSGGLPGAGGSGARAWNYGPGYNGGSGAKGQVIISYVYTGCLDGTLTLTSPAGTDNQSVCHNIPIEDIKYTIGGFATGAEAEGLPNGLASSFNAGVITISGTPSESGTFNYTVSTTGVPDTCQEGLAYGTINVSQVPGVTDTVKVVFDASGNWTVPDGVNSLMVEAWGGGGSGGGVEISIFGIGGGGGGGAYAFKNNLAVIPLETLQIIVAGETPGNSASDGADGSASTIQGYEDEIFADGGKAGKRSASIFSNGSAEGGSGGSSVVSNGDCTVGGMDGTDGYRFELLDQPDDDAGKGGNGATISGGAGGTAVGDFIGDGNPGSAPGGGGSGSRSGLTTTFNTVGGTGAAGQVIIYFECPDVTDGGEIEPDQTICENTVPGTIENKTLASGETGDIDYQWQQSTVSNTTGFSDIPDANEASYTPDTLTETTWYKRLAKSFCDPDWTAAVESNVVKITLVEVPEIPVISFSDVTQTSFKLTWNSTQTGIPATVSYTLDVSTTSDFLNSIPGSPFTVTEPDTSLSVEGLDSYTSYYFRISAIADICSSDYSDTGIVQTLPMPVEVNWGTENVWKGYNHLKPAFDAVNDGTHKGEITILIFDDLTETQTCVLNVSGTGGSDYSVLGIYPGYDSLVTVQGNIQAPLIDLNGASNLIISGTTMNKGTNQSVKNLTFINYNLYQPVIRIQNGSDQVEISDCILLGCNTQNTSTASQGGIVYIGGTNNSQGNKNISIQQNKFAEINGNMPAVALYIKGMQNAENESVFITGNEFENFSRSGIYVNCYLKKSAFEENSFINTLSSAFDQTGIYINSNCSEIAITDNIIGSQIQPAIWKKAGGSFTGIRYVATPAGAGEETSAISGNFIGRIDWNPGKWNDFTGIYTEGNGPLLIGDDGTDNDFSGGNTIGFISQGSSSSISLGMFGIYSKNAGQTIIGGNTITYLAGTATPSGLVTRGIHSENGSVSILYNKITNLSSGSANTAASGAAVAVYRNTTVNSGTIITGNEISDIRNTNTSGSAISVTGIYLNDPASGSVWNEVTLNNISNLNLSSTSTSGQITGLMLAGGQSKVINNMISLGFDESSGYIIRGIFKTTSNRATLYFNTVVIGGSSVASNVISAAFQATGLDFDLKNNIMLNKRSTYGKNFAVITSASGGFNSNFNNLTGAKTNECGSYNSGATSVSFTGWKSSTLKDNSSMSMPVVFTSESAGNLHIKDEIANNPLKSGTFITGLDFDYDADDREPVPWMGADEHKPGDTKSAVIEGTEQKAFNEINLETLIYSSGKDVHINVSKPVKAVISIIDLMGQTIGSVEENLDMQNVYTFDLSPGYYIIKIQSHESLFTKVVKID